MNETKACSVDEPGHTCSPGELKRGMCGAHYARWRRYGDPLAYSPLAEERARRKAERTCSVDEPGHTCSPGKLVRGMCSAHHNRWLKYGDPLARARLAGLSADERFRRQTERVGECLIWTGYKTLSGYGSMGIGRVPTRAHRVAWTLAYGPIPDGLYVLHRCPEHRRDCVAVEHLYLGDAKQNYDDMVADGTAVRGERHHSARLTEADVRAIRADPRNNTEVARAYGLDRSHVGQIRSRKAWKHVA